MRYTQYIYLVFAIYFVYDGITKWNAGDDTPWLSFIIAGMAVFMFLFRRMFLQKIDKQNKKK